MWTLTIQYANTAAPSRALRAEVKRSVPYLERAMKKVSTHLKVQKNEFSVLLTDDETIQELNRTYRKKNKPTDVLAFALQEGEFAHLAGPALGDIAVSVETAHVQALERHWPLQDELLFLVVHGLLHLLGHDHQNDTEERRMNRVARAALAHAGQLEPRPASPASTAVRAVPRSPTPSRARAATKDASRIGTARAAKVQSKKQDKKS
jgi:probable rRNA maturation factor